MITIFPFYFVEILKFTPTQFGYFSGGFALLWGTGCFLSRYVSHHTSLEKAGTIGLAGTFVGSCLMLAVNWINPYSVELICGALAIHLIFYGVMYPPMTALALASIEKNRGVASSLNQTFSTLSCGLGAFAASLLDDTSLLPLTVFMIIVNALCIAIQFIGHRSS